MTLAVGGGSSATLAHNPYWVNVRDFGAKPDNVTDNTAAFQAAVDWVAAKIAATIPNGLRTVGTVFVPADAGTYMLSRPVWVDSPFIEIRGEGQGSRISNYFGTCHSLFIFGLRRTVPIIQNGQSIVLQADSTYRPDLFGKLDSTVAPTPGVKWGFRSHGDAIIQSQVSPLSVGCRSSRQDFTTDNWTEATALTVEFAVESPSGQLQPGLSLVGIGIETADVAYPFYVYTDDTNDFVVKFATQSVPFGPQTIRRFSFSSGNATGVQRIAFQIDLSAPAVSAFVNGVQVSTVNGLGSDWGPGLRFAENDFAPLLVADNGGTRPALGAPNGFDFSLYGLLFSRAARYRNLGAGQTQQRADGGQIDDRYRYFTDRYTSSGNLVDPGMVGYLTFSEDPSKLDRVLSVQGGAPCNFHVASAYLLHALQSTPGGIGDNAISDVHLIGGNIYGQNVGVGQVLDLKITGVRSSGSYHAIGSIANGANYTVRVEDCVFDATDSGYFGLDQAVWMRNITFGGAGRATMRFAGCVVDAHNCFVGFWAPNNQSTIKIHASDYGGNYTFSNVIVDYEGDAYAHTAFYCEAHPYPSVTSLRLKDVYLGTTGNVPIITLRDGAPWYPPAYLSVENLQIYTAAFKGLLDVSSNKWQGEIIGILPPGSPRVTSPSTSRVVIKETGWNGPPRAGSWSSGGHNLEVCNPIDGQFSRWICLAPGTFGTASPPLWAGVNAVHNSMKNLAGYVLNVAWMTVNLS